MKFKILIPDVVTRSLHRLMWASLVVMAGASSGAAAAAAGPAPGSGHSVALFIVQILLMLVFGRLLGEAMQRIGQPAVMGQLLGGIVLGPSLFGLLLPELYQLTFPASLEQKSMIDAVSQLGILMLLLLTGMETNPAVIAKARRAAFSVSLAGIIVPFAIGFTLGWLMPESLLPNPESRLITALFIGTALSIASVKIVAAVVREMDFMRRRVGQIIVGAAVIDDTVGWLIIAIIFGIAIEGRLDPLHLGKTVLGTLAFLVFSFTVGRRIVSRLIRWANDRLQSEYAVITMILTIMGVMALITDAIGVHTVLGAFVAGILIGQSPILTRHIDEQLRGLIVALFMPVFFAGAGLSTDLTILANPLLLALSVGFILIASIGKFAGAFVGGALGGLTGKESLALAFGMNARGSTEVIVASIGLSMGALSRDLFSMIVAMAIITTMMMPPTLRWALRRIPLTPEERDRIEREDADAKGFVPNLERILVAVDDSPNGRFAAHLAGLLAGTRGILSTVLPMSSTDAGAAAGEMPRADKADAAQAATAGDLAAAETMRVALAAGAEAGAATDGAPPQGDVEVGRVNHDELPHEAVAREARKGFGLLVVGVHDTADAQGDFTATTARIVNTFTDPVMVIAGDGGGRAAADREGENLDMLVAVSGTPYSDRAAEVAFTLAAASKSRVTVLYVSRTAGKLPWFRRVGVPVALGAQEAVILKNLAELGKRLGIEPTIETAAHRSPEDAILTQLARGKHNVVVLGVTRRQGESLFFGATAKSILRAARSAVVMVAT